MHYFGAFGRAVLKSWLKPCCRVARWVASGSVDCRLADCIVVIDWLSRVLYHVMVQYWLCEMPIVTAVWMGESWMDGSHNWQGDAGRRWLLAAWVVLDAGVSCLGGVGGGGGDCWLACWWRQQDGSKTTCTPRHRTPTYWDKSYPAVAPVLYNPKWGS